jgi:hypothetical protein
MRNFILNIKFIRYHPIWWWVRLMSHSRFHFDDYHIWKEFWCSLNRGYHDTEYRYQFEKVWGKNAKPERIVLSQRDFDSLQRRLSEPPKFNQGLSDLLTRKAPWEDE